MARQLSRLTPVVRALTGVDVSSVGAWWAGPGRDEPEDSGPPAIRRGCATLTAAPGADPDIPVSDSVRAVLVRRTAHRCKASFG
jgi:hypothetical protein